MALMSWVLAIPLLGMMTGARTMTPMAVLCWFAYFGSDGGHLPLAGTWAFWAGKLVTAIIFTVLAVGELIGDKLPKTPNRTSPGALIARLVFGGLVGGIAATGVQGSLPEGVSSGSSRCARWDLPDLSGSQISGGVAAPPGLEHRRA